VASTRGAGSTLKPQPGERRKEKERVEKRTPRLPRCGEAVEEEKERGKRGIPLVVGKKSIAPLNRSVTVRKKKKKGGEKEAKPG